MRAVNRASRGVHAAAVASAPVAARCAGVAASPAPMLPRTGLLLLRPSYARAYSSSPRTMSFFSGRNEFDPVPAAAAEAAPAEPAAAAPAAPLPLRLPLSNDLPDWADPPQPQLLSLADLAPRPQKRALRYGRGRASGLGKTCGRGIKGQGQRKGLRKRGFEGGSTPFWRRMPKLSANTHSRYYKMLTPLSVDRLLTFIRLGRIDASQLITMKTLVDSGCVEKVAHGVKLLSAGATSLPRALHVQVTDCSEQARRLLESNGGSLHLVWFNRVTLRAHLHPLKFLRKHGRLPKHTGVPPPKKAAKYGYVIEHVDY